MIRSRYQRTLQCQLAFHMLVLAYISVHQNDESGSVEVWFDLLIVYKCQGNRRLSRIVLLSQSFESKTAILQSSDHRSKYD